MSLVFDEYGRPFVIIKNQKKKERKHGIESIKSNILAIRAITEILKTSLGPRGLDKMIVSQDGEITITNDGATILKEIDVVHPGAKMVVDIAQTQDSEVGDGTTGVIVLLGAILAKVYRLLDMGVSPSLISSTLHSIIDDLKNFLYEISEDISQIEDSYDFYLKVAKTTLSSKIVSSFKEKIAKIAVDSVLSVANLNRKDVEIDNIQIIKRVGGNIGDIQLYSGILIDKGFSHPNMIKEAKNVKIAILTCPFEPAKPKTTHKLLINSSESYSDLRNYENEVFRNQIKSLKNNNVDISFCQWGFDDDANSLLFKNDILAVRWVGGQEIEYLAMVTGGRIIPKFDLISENKLGFANSVREISVGNSENKMILVENDQNCKIRSILLRGSSKMMIDEVERSLHDAICIVKSLITNSRVVYGGGSVEIAISNYLNGLSKSSDINRSIILSHIAEAFLEIPLALSSNSGYQSYNSISDIISRQLLEANCFLGVDCCELGSNDMKELGVVESFESKLQQINLSIQLCQMILKTNEFICEDFSSTD